MILRRAARSDLNAHRRVGTGIAALLAATAALGVGLVAGPAAADPPLNVTDELVDETGVLDARADDVRAAQAALTDATNLQLFVVFVPTFDGATGVDWATQTAELSGLGQDDLLLAVAVEDRAYGLVADSGAPVSDADQDTIRSEVLEPQLGDDNWAGAVIDTAQALEDAATGAGVGSSNDGGSSGGSGFGGILTWFLLGLVVIGAILVVRSLRSRSRGGSGAQRGPVGAGGPDEPAPVDSATLDRQASAALVTLDDELRASEQELGFAQAQFGEEATRAFTDVLAAAKADALEAFGLRQRLDDSVPETEDERRGMLTQILTLCTRADAALSEQTADFDELRDLQARAPELLEENYRRAAEVGGRIEPARRALASLAGTYPASSLASVAANPDQAAKLLEAAHASIVVGKAAMTDDDRAGAVEAARTAEHAVAQAVNLLDAVDRAGAELAGASAAIAAGIESLGSDLSDAERLAPNDPAVRTAAAAAATARVAAQAAGPGSDPLALTRDLRNAEAALDKALEPARGEAERSDRSRAQLVNAIGPLQSRLRGVGDYIETRRGAVGPEARTRLAEAQRLAAWAEDFVRTDPPRGLEAVQRADELAAQAQWQAQADVEEFERRRNGPGNGGRGGGSNAGSLILGGILLGDLLGGGGRGGGGGFGGGFGGGGGGFGGGGGGFGGGGGGGGFGGGGGGGGFGGGGGRF